jgi:hypothetical protein
MKLISRRSASRGKLRHASHNAGGGFSSDHGLPYDAGPLGVQSGADRAPFQPELHFRNRSVDSKVEAFGTHKIEENQNMTFHLLPNQKRNFEQTNPRRVTTELTRVLSGLLIICLYFAELREQ